jgi:hypothetical protein
MRAVVLNSFDGPDAVCVSEVDDPVAADGQVLVRVEAAAIGPWDPGRPATTLGPSWRWAAMPRPGRIGGPAERRQDRLHTSHLANRLGLAEGDMQSGAPDRFEVLPSTVDK